MLSTPRLSAAFLIVLALATGCSVPESVQESNQDSNNSAALINPKAQEAPKIPLLSPENPDPTVQQDIERYLAQLGSRGFLRDAQGVWIQTEDTLLASHQGTTPLPAASVTKVATSLAALSTFGTDHQFITQISTNGTIENGVLQGDLIVQGGEDPFFVWEEAIELGNALNSMGIQRVTGDIIVVDSFYMNFESDPLKAGNFLKEAINSQAWSSAARTQYNTLPAGTAQPQVVVEGTVQVAANAPRMRSLVRHHSLPMAELLKKMNQYSNNAMAEMIAQSAGGANEVSKKAATAAGVPQNEISLINGSGLGEDNRISPRAAVAMFLAIERMLEPQNMTLGNVLSIVGQDEGILNSRFLPRFSVVKSGSLSRVSALAGALPTQNNGTVWFAILNSQGELEGFRTQQESLLSQFSNNWGAVSALPQHLTPLAERQLNKSRNEIVQ